MADRVPFAVDVRFERAPDGVAIVAVAGEVDLATVAELRSTLSRVIAPPREEVVVDLAGVEFIDASGLGALVGAAAAAARAGVKFRLTAPSPPVERVFELARIDDGLVAGL
jgi:anti-sigma B factor antagonist